MRNISFILSVVSLAAVIGLGAFSYNLSNRMEQMTAAQSEIQRNVTQNINQTAAENQKNTEAVANINNRINRLIDLVK